MTKLSEVFEAARKELEGRRFYNGKDYQQISVQGIPRGPICLLMALARVAPDPDLYNKSVRVLQTMLNATEPDRVMLSVWSDRCGKAAVLCLFTQARDRQRVMEGR